MRRRFTGWGEVGIRGIEEGDERRDKWEGVRWSEMVLGFDAFADPFERGQ